MATFRLLSVALLLGACASSQQPQTATVASGPPAAAQTPAPALDPAGSYEFSTMVDGQSVTGTMHVEGAPGAYKGRIVTTVFPEIPITSASTEGNVVTLTGALPEGDLKIRMTMEGSNFKGTWAIGPDSGEISGRKLPKQ